MTSISVNDCVGNSPKQLADHVSLVAFRNRVESLLYDMAAEWVHTQRDDIAMNGISDSNDLVGRAMLETSLNKEVAKSVDHERVSLVDDGFHDLELLLSSANLQLLLQEDGSLLIVVADDLVDNILPVA